MTDDKPAEPAPPEPTTPTTPPDPSTDVIEPANPFEYPKIAPQAIRKSWGQWERPPRDPDERGR